MVQKLRKLYDQYSVLVNFYVLLVYFLLMQFLLLRWESTEQVLAKQLPIAIAYISAQFLTLIGYESVSMGSLVNIVGQFRFTIVYHCTGILGMIIFVSAVLAFPSTVKEKIVGILFGIPVLNIVNVVRVSLLGVVGIYSKEVFDFCHHYLLQGVFIAFVIVTWLIWRVKMVRSEVGAVVPS